MINFLTSIITLILFRGKPIKGAFRAIYPNKARIVFDRFEESERNVKKIVEVFDTNVGIKFTWSGGGLPNPSPNTYKYTLVGGSVYGAAKYNGT